MKKICIKCNHSRFTELRTPNNYCVNEKCLVTPEDLVTGSLYCEKARRNEETCGLEGKLFEEKDKPVPRKGFWSFLTEKKEITDSNNS